MNNTPSDIPYRRLSGFYFLYFALLGCIAPFWGLYLQYRSFSALEIGSLMAAFAGVRIVAPNLWAWWACYFSSPISMVRVSGLMTAVCFSAVWWANSFVAMLLVMVAYGFFWAAMLPQYETITMQSLKNRIDDYSRIRVWGSLGFIVVVLVLGWLFELVGIQWLPAVMLLVMVLILLNSLLFRSGRFRTRKAASDDQTFLTQMMQRPVLIFIVMTILLQVSHGAYYTFFSIYLEAAGYSKTGIGFLWSLGVFAEVILFWQFHRLMHWLSWRGWILLSLVITAIRWLMIAEYVEVLSVLLLAQLMHAFSFGVMHAVAMRYVQHYFSAEAQARGQALYSSVGFGLGGAIGAWGCGVLWSRMPGDTVFLISAGVALIALLISWAGLRPDE
ncbi:MFS transporter [Bacterioplanoides sp.]|uniref:MFS transporter n=1 Tax=Bacterioplanoides sp. TaxID=2066072 RepID=UPI003B008353